MLLKVIQSDGKILETKSVWLDDKDYSQVHFIDQRYIPFRVDVKTSLNVRMTSEFIKQMVVRGAPAIGGAAAYGVVQSVVEHQAILNTQEKRQKIRRDLDLLLASRPTAVDLQNVIQTLNKKLDSFSSFANIDLVSLIREEAETIVATIIQECTLLAETGFPLIKDGMNILHHCNTGPLATIDGGSALGIIIGAHKKGKKIHCYVDETRPRLQGGRLTTWELTQEGVPHTLIVDTVSATLMSKGKIDLILVGADRIARNGDFANKIGTYNLAVLANYHKVPMYTVAPWSTFDKSIETGLQIPIEERSTQEVTHAFSEDLQMRQISYKSPVFNPAFDVTPHELLTGIIAPGQIIEPPFKENIAKALEHVKTRR